MLLAGVIRAVVTNPLKDTCITPVSYYAIDGDDDWTVARGVYRNYREGLSRGRAVYVGTITHYQNNEAAGKPIPVLREVQYKGEIMNNLVRLTATGNSRRIGDHSSTEDVTKYVFPYIATGTTSTFSLYLLNGEAMATGTEATPRSLCVN